MKETRAYFDKKGIAAARLDAELLLAHVLNKDRVQLYLDYNCPVTVDELGRYRELVKRRAAREPVAYITGIKEFWSIELGVSPAVLIPRPDTEVLVERAVALLVDGASTKLHLRVLDIGTGSGALAVALARELTTVSVVGLDVSPGALAVAQRNINACGLQDRVQLVCGNATASLKPMAEFDIIIANPPYVCTGDLERLEPEVADYEPRSALDGGADGLRFYRSWIPGLPEFLCRDGHVLFEIGCDQGAAVSDL
ncbi:MAG: peptide chain release factor N(5)-glutamine methyltransferase, partial [Deltaproteobacteria bacterium]|nr:peptide chain release factor N(5)-glutamine methyltransferase [Deltaproteobacteria bacterium]